MLSIKSLATMLAVLALISSAMAACTNPLTCGAAGLKDTCCDGNTCGTTPEDYKVLKCHVTGSERAKWLKG